MVSLKFFVDIILPAALWSWDRLSLWQKWVPGIFPGDKGGRYVVLTILPPSGADCFKIWELPSPGTLRACIGIILPLRSPLYAYIDCDTECFRATVLLTYYVRTHWQDRLCTCNFEVRSCNFCWRAKALSYIFWVYIYNHVYPVRKARAAAYIVICSLSGSIMFCHVILKLMWFLEKKRRY
jgi:hypothetical protein